MAARHVIVGSGIAGLSAAESIRLRDPRATITMVSEEPHAFYSRPGLAYLLRGDIPERQLFLRTRDDLRELCIERVTAPVDSLDLDDHAALLSDGRQVPYDRLLLATGALASPPSFPGSELAGIFKLDSLDDARRLVRAARRARTAVVIGGGITALELAEGLAARGVKVHYFLRGDRYWGDVLDEDESAIVQTRLAHEGISIHTRTQVGQAFGRRGRLAGVETQSGARIACEMLAVAIGVRPRADLARKAGLEVNRGIIVDPHLQTSRPDVFAAGDVAEVRDPACPNSSSLDVLWPTALEQGRIAGANMAGERVRYSKTIAFNATLLAGLRVTIIGAVGGGTDDDLITIGRGDSEEWRVLPRGWILSDRDDVNRIRLVIGDRAILGALVMGDQAWSRPLQRLIAARADISPIAGELRAAGPEALRRLAAFYDDWDDRG